MKSMLRLALACLLLGLVVAAPAANAADTKEILRDCADDGVLQGDYTTSELRKARQNIPTDADQYTDCRDVIARAASRGVSGDGGGGGGGGSGGGGSGGGGALLTPATDEDRRSLSDGLTRGSEAQDIGGRAVVPGQAGFAAGAVRNDLPVTLIVLLCLLGLAALAAAVPRVRRGFTGAGSVAGFLRGHGLRRG